MKKTAFLDRDGVLNKELGRYTRFADELVVLDHAIKACNMLHKEGYQLIVITNQGGIAKGEYSEQDLAKTHAKLKNSIPEIKAIFHCPHHDIIGNCLCRKPKSLLLDKAIYLFDVDRENSFFIGDSERDIQAAEKAGIKGIKINANEDWSTIV